MVNCRGAGGAMIFSSYGLRKPRHKMIRQLAWGHTSGKWCCCGGTLLLHLFVRQSDLSLCVCPLPSPPCSFVLFRSIWWGMLFHASYPLSLPISLSLSLSVPISSLFSSSSFICSLLYSSSFVSFSQSPEGLCLWKLVSDPRCQSCAAGMSLVPQHVDLPPWQLCLPGSCCLLQSTGCYLATNYTHVS